MPPKKPPPDPLADYRAKRDAGRTPEPEGQPEPPRKSPGGTLRFVVHKHAARRLHWDLRLEHDGVLWSWAIPNGPSRDPAEKRLAVRTEDHPLMYAEFEDVIPAGNYGAGAMILWDEGTYLPLLPMEEGLAKGKLLVELRGHKLRGTWTLVKMRKAEEEAWLLIKERDALAVAGPDAFPEDSVTSGLTVEELGSGDDPGEKVRNELRRLKAPRRLLDPAATALMLAESATAPFSRSGWVFEFKYDGYRTLAFREDDDVRLLSRRGNDFSAAFPELVRALRRLPYRRFLVDGEIVVEDEAGLPSFQRLQQRARLRRTPDILRGELTLPAKLWLFDLLGFEDRDTRGLPLLQRKALLRRLLPSVGTLRYSEHVEQHGEALYEQAARLRLEGVIGKRADGPYRSGRSAEWLKVRAYRTEEFVIVGWTAPKGGRSGFGAIHLAQFDDGTLRFAGQAGSGFTDRQLVALHKQLEKARLPAPSCVGAPSGRGHYWTRPELVCEVRYLERTEEGLLRQPVFLRLRDDKTPGECVWSGESPSIVLSEPGPSRRKRSAHPGARPVIGDTDPVVPSEAKDPQVEADLRERQILRFVQDDRKRAQDDRKRAQDDRKRAQDGKERTQDDRKAARAKGNPARAEKAGAETDERTVQFSNLDKVFWPDDGYTKSDLIGYYRDIAPWILPYLRDRPIVLTRFPDGIHGKSFFQKDAPSFAPKWLRTVTIAGDDGEKTPSYFVCDDEATLLYLANSGSIPLHVWASRVEAIERPDWCILDLDPKEAPFTHVIAVAHAAKALCDDIDLPLYIKTSGSSGLHLLVPLGALLDHEQAKSLGELLARVLVRNLREIATITRQVERRQGKVYIDYLQNGRGKLLVAPFSVRPLPGAPVSTPLRWKEVEPGLDIHRFTIRSVPRRVRLLKGDPLLPVLSETPDLLAALDALQGRL